MSYEYSIATLAEGVAGLQLLREDLGVIDPHDNPIPYSVERETAGGGVRGFGWSIIEWHWNIITVAEWNILRTYCPDKSQQVYIRSFEVHENQSYANYLATMIWPNSRQFVTTKVLDFTIVFQGLVEQ